MLSFTLKHLLTKEIRVELVQVAEISDCYDNLTSVNQLLYFGLERIISLHDMMTGVDLKVALSH